MSIFRENHLENEHLKQFVEASAQVMLDLLSSYQREGKLLDLAERSDLAFSTGAHTIKLQPLAQSMHFFEFDKRNVKNTSVLL